MMRNIVVRVIYMGRCTLYTGTGPIPYLSFPSGEGEGNHTKAVHLFGYLYLSPHP